MMVEAYEFSAPRFYSILLKFCIITQPYFIYSFCSWLLLHFVDCHTKLATGLEAATRSRAARYLVTQRPWLVDGKMMYNDRRMINENPVKVPFKNDLTAPREEYSQQQYLKRSSIVDNQPHKYQAMMFVQRRDAVEVSEDDESAKTSSSMD
ncbi:hypothetical protein CASFOL_034377 [Castilleja foliolosa]|uniref:Uncharacterized protein n=1 Tax=Castilleja foliolosa TaxID=1961234 RepID=A0ABD3BWQ7_9LAMI